MGTPCSSWTIVGGRAIAIGSHRLRRLKISPATDCGIHIEWVYK